MILARRQRSSQLCVHVASRRRSENYMHPCHVAARTRRTEERRGVETVINNCDAPIRKPLRLLHKKRYWWRIHLAGEGIAMSRSKCDFLVAAPGVSINHSLTRTMFIATAVRMC